MPSPRLKKSKGLKLNDTLGENEALVQLGKLWAALPRPTPKHVLRVFTRKDGKFNGDFAKTFAELEHFVAANQDKNLYVAPNPTTSRSAFRHTAMEVTHWSYFLIDIDPVEDKSDPQSALEEALLWLGEWVGRDFKRRRPIIIDSGRGYQAWIRLEDVEFDETTTRHVARRVNGYWLKRLDEKLSVAKGCRIDTSVSDLPRVMRCPGTVNQKTGRLARFIVESDEVFTGLASLLTVGTPQNLLIEVPPTPVVPGRSWQKVFGHLTVMAQNYLLHGQVEPGRHKVVWHTAKKLREVGCTVEETRKALARANRLRGEDNELSGEDIEHALKTAYGDLTNPS